MISADSPSQVDPTAPAPDPAAIFRDPRFLALLVVASLVGVVASLCAWGFLELVYYVQRWTFTDIPRDLGFGDPPLWWPLPVLALAGLVTAIAIERLPGHGGHDPVKGLDPTPTMPAEVPGVVLAGLASISLGMVLGPEAPLIAIGSALGIFVSRRMRAAESAQVGQLLGASATFAALGFLFGSPIVAAAILIEATGLGGKRLPLVLVPGLLASGIGSLVWIGMGNWTGLSTADIALSPLRLDPFPSPDLADFAWTIALAAAVAVAMVAIFRLAEEARRVLARRRYLLLPAAGLLVAGLAIAFSQAADKEAGEVLFSGQDSLGSLVEGSGSWSLGALAMLVGLKGLAYALSLGGFRGGPVFPAIFLGAAAGLIAADLPGFSETPAVAVGIGAGVVAVLGLPLAGSILGIVLTASAGPAVAPLVIVGVVVAYLVRLVLTDRVAAG